LAETKISRAAVKRDTGNVYADLQTWQTERDARTVLSAARASTELYPKLYPPSV